MFALWPKRSIVHALVFVRLAHDRRFVGAVLLVLALALVLFVFIRISGRHCVARDHEGSPVEPGGKFLGDVWGHVVAPRAWTLGEARQHGRPYRMRSSATARAESCPASWTPACAILMICFAIISVRGSSRSLTQRVCNACSYASVMRLISCGSKVEFFNRR